jgi:hypothetical protein
MNYNANQLQPKKSRNPQSYNSAFAALLGGERVQRSVHGKRLQGDIRRLFGLPAGQLNGGDPMSKISQLLEVLVEKEYQGGAISNAQTEGAAVSTLAGLMAPQSAALAPLSLNGFTKMDLITLVTGAGTVQKNDDTQVIIPHLDVITNQQGLYLADVQLPSFTTAPNAAPGSGILTRFNIPNVTPGPTISGVATEIGVLGYLLRVKWSLATLPYTIRIEVDSRNVAEIVPNDASIYETNILIPAAATSADVPPIPSFSGLAYYYGGGAGLEVTATVLDGGVAHSSLEGFKAFLQPIYLTEELKSLVLLGS